MIVFLLISLLAILVFFMYGLELPLRRDNAQYIYTAQRLLHGEMPYQSLFDMKTPLASFVTALALFISQSFFDEPLKGVRLFYIAMCIATTLLIYVLANKLFKHKYEALLAPLMMIGFHGYIIQSAIGAEPRLLLLFLLVIGLILLVDKKWFFLGLVAALCSFTWQPSGVLFIAALIYAAVQISSRRADALLKLIVGFLVPSAVIFGIFLLNGAFKELLQGALIVHFYLSRPDQNEFLNIAKMLPFGFPFSFVLIIVSLIAFGVHSIRSMFSNENPKLSDNPYLPFAVMLVIFAFASLLDFQGYPDFSVFLPFSALGMVILYKSLFSYMESKRLSAISISTSKSAFYLVLLIIPFLNASFSGVFSTHAAIWRGAILEQTKTYSEIVRSALGNYDANSRIIVIGVPEIPALLGFQNGTQYVSMGSIQGFDDFIASNYSNGFPGWLEEMSRKKSGFNNRKDVRCVRIFGQEPDFVYRMAGREFFQVLAKRKSSIRDISQ